jgi:hypothetical protein
MPFTRRSSTFVESFFFDTRLHHFVAAVESVVITAELSGSSFILIHLSQFYGNKRPSRLPATMFPTVSALSESTIDPMEVFR